MGLYQQGLYLSIQIALDQSIHTIFSSLLLLLDELLIDSPWHHINNLVEQVDQYSQLQTGQVLSRMRDAWGVSRGMKLLHYILDVASVSSSMKQGQYFTRVLQYQK